MSRLERIVKFEEEYTKQLTQAVTEFPSDYPWYAPGDMGRLKIETVVGRMMRAIEANDYNKDGKALKRTCAALGISHTYTAINRWFSSDPN